MRKRKGFTLIELMVVVLIVAVLAAILVPLMTARLEAARWSEGKAGAGTIATAIRAMYAEEGDAFDDTDLDVETYCNPEDLYGKYFNIDCYEITSLDVPGTGNYAVTYTIVVSAPDTVSGAPNGAAGSGNAATWKVSTWTLDHIGDWTKAMK